MSIYSTLKSQDSQISSLKGGTIIAGGGYSTDSQQVAPQACYNATASIVSGAQSYARLDTAMSFSDISSEVLCILSQCVYGVGL